uniref:ZP domain-containing protein n=1 Tax=Parastrongyloides trichosuri TaxID=131310 RepID=A0A0N4ZMZ9_PARTI
MINIYYYIFIISILIYLINSISIDNQMIGVPLIQCTDQAIVFSIKTKNVFRGNIYIKGNYGLERCKHEYFDNQDTLATFSVKIGDCGMKRVRQLQPHGINYILVFVTTFHPQFVTVIDKAYNVRCFYAQADTEVRSGVEVDSLQIENLEQASTHIPNCAYSVRMNSVDGQPVKFVRIGEQLVHRWECDNPDYGILIKNCFVSDGGTTAVQVVDGRGCPIFSPVIQGQITYSDNLKLAFVPVWAYKFPDRSQVYFKCQIQVCNIKENECLGVTPPNCPIISKQDYVPNAFINPIVDPEKVVGTFTADEVPTSINTKNILLDGGNKGIYRSGPIAAETQIPPLMKDSINKNVRSVHDVKTFKQLFVNPFKKQKLFNEKNNYTTSEDNNNKNEDDMDMIGKRKITRIRPKSEHILETLNRVKRNLSIFKKNNFINNISLQNKLVNVTADPVIVSDPEMITKDNKIMSENKLFTLANDTIKEKTISTTTLKTNLQSFISESESWCLHKTLLTFLISVIILLIIILVILTIFLSITFYRLRHGYNITKGFYNLKAIDGGDYHVPPASVKRSHKNVENDHVKKFNIKNLNNDFIYTKRLKVTKEKLLSKKMNMSTLNSKYYSPVAKRYIQPIWRHPLVSNLNCQAALDTMSIHSRSKDKEYRKLTYLPYTFSTTCDDIKRRGYYPDEPLSKEEADFPIAFVRTVYTDYLTLEMQYLISYAPQNHYCYIIDRKQNAEFHSRMFALSNCFQNIYIISDSYDMDSNGNNVNRANYECMKYLNGKDYKYLIVLNNDDMPLKTNRELVEILKIYNGSVIIDYDSTFENIANRIDFNLNWTLGHLEIFNEDDPRNLDNEILKSELVFQKGFVEIGYPKETIDYIVNKLNITKFLTQLNDMKMYASDEMSFQTLMTNEYLNIPGRIDRECVMEDNVFHDSYIGRYTKWYKENNIYYCNNNEMRHWICLMTIKNINELKSLPHLYVNKFKAETDFGGLMCWVEYVYNRTYFEEYLTINQSFYEDLPPVRYNKLKSQIEDKRKLCDLSKKKVLNIN